MPTYNGYGGYTPNPYVYGAQPNYTPVQPYQQPMQQTMQTQAQQPVQPAQTPVQPQMQSVPPKTNKQLVTSYEDAMNRYVEPNSLMVYTHQDEPFQFQIYTDWEGKKTPRIFKITEYSLEQMQDEIKGVAKTDLEGYARVEDLEKIKGSIVTKDDLADLESRLVQYIKQSTLSVTPKKQTEIPVD